MKQAYKHSFVKLKVSTLNIFLFPYARTKLHFSASNPNLSSEPMLL